MTHGPYGWQEKVIILKQRSDWLCKRLSRAGIVFYRHDHSNIVTIDAKSVPHDLAHQYGLVPDNHENPNWFKIVIMEHVSMERIEPFIEELLKRNS
jgi:hypothetical protein